MALGPKAGRLPRFRLPEGFSDPARLGGPASDPEGYGFGILARFSSCLRCRKSIKPK
jgi:hypothetical protein